MIKYLGSKRLLLTDIQEICQQALPSATTFLDLFSGTSRVGHAMKRAGLYVTANDYLHTAHTLARCYVEADSEEVGDDARSLIAELQQTKPVEGWFTQTYSHDSRFIHPRNAAKVEGIREAIEKKSLPPILKSVVLTSLLEAADRVDSTCGVQMAYLKSWAKRAGNELRLRMPEVLPGGGLALLGNAADVDVEVDIAYLDPPYNQHSYLGNYHLWESLVVWDKPEVYGVACKRIECREKKSDFNQKRRVRAAFTEVLSSLRAKLVILSFSDEGFLSRDDLVELLEPMGEVEVHARDYRRYVGAQIGIHNDKGERVGRVSHLRNQEYFFVVRTRELRQKAS